MGRLDNKVAIVTGAASGMGKEIALLFAQEGAKVVATDIQEDKLNEVITTITEAGGGAIAVKHDVSKRASWEDALAKTLEAYQQVDILINNAGVSLAKSFLDVTDQEWDRVLRINLDSVFFGMQLVCAELIKEKHAGSIVNIASMAGMVGNSAAGPYTASKGAVRAISKAAAVDMARYGIRVNAIHPGYIETEMSANLFADPQYRNMFDANTPLPYLGKPDDISYACLYLASDESKFVTGVDLPIDGGVIAK